MTISIRDLIPETSKTESDILRIKVKEMKDLLDEIRDNFIIPSDDITCCLNYVKSNYFFIVPTCAYKLEVSFRDGEVEILIRDKDDTGTVVVNKYLYPEPARRKIAEFMSKHYVVKECSF